MNINPEEYDNIAYVVGGGPSLCGFNWELLNDPNKFVVAINTAHKVLPNCNLIYLTDPPYIQANLATLTAHKAPIWQGVLNLNNPKKLPVVDKQIHLVGTTGLVAKVVGDSYEVAHGSNSTFAFVQIAVAIGFKRIYLLGIDQKWGDDKKETSHWHSKNFPHARVDGSAVYKKTLENWKTIKQPLLDMGVEVISINTPEGTDLKVFPIVSVKEAFNLPE